ncbi:MAG TPA: winged helix-turn-helix domain-containing protein [Thermoanaerobaculia bacterium]|nr:winged helix-turn-helix domain-containing protein [Thermoanaerobaculia bacterium]
MTFDPTTGTLLGEPGLRRLTPRAAAVLQRLIESPGSVVSKTALLDDVWDGVAVSDEALTTVVYELRQALGDSARDQRYVETLRRRGYRWVAPPPIVSDAPPVAPVPVEGRAVHRRLVAAGGWLAVLALAITGGTLPPPNAAPATSASAAPSPAACAAYYRGIGAAARGTAEATQRAAEHLERALRLSPSWASGHLAVAEAYLELARSTGAEALERSRAAVSAAERLGAPPGELHLARASLLLDAEGDVAGARAELERARRSATCGTDQIDLRAAEILSAAGHHHEAVRRLVGLAEESPGVSKLHRALGRAHHLGGALAAAEASLERALELAPAHVPTLRRLAIVRERRGDAGGSWQALRDEAYALALAPERLIELEEAWHTGGLPAVRRWRLGHAAILGLSPVERAAQWALAGELAAAARELDRAHREGYAGLAWVGVEPAFEALREDDRFRTLVDSLAPAGPLTQI